MPGLQLVQQDVLETDWVGLAVEKGGPLSLIGNLPFNISSQILFDIIDNRRAVSHAVFTTQYEVNSTPYTSHTVPRLLNELSLRLGQKNMVSSLLLSNYFVVLNINLQFPPLHFTLSQRFPLTPVSCYLDQVQSGLVYFNFKKPHPRIESVRTHQLRK